MESVPYTDDGFVPIPAVLSREVDNIVLMFGSSSDETWKAHAFKVNQVNRRIERINNLPTLEPGGSLDFGYMGDDGHSQDVNSPGRDRLRVGDDRNETLVEYGIAVKPHGVLVGIENPADATVTGVIDADRLRGFAPQAANSNDFNTYGSVRSESTHTDHGIPTTALSPTNQQGVFRFDKAEDERNNIYAGFYNTREDEASLEVVAHGAAYKVTHVDDTQVTRDMAFGDGYNRRVATYGGLANTRPRRPDSWLSGEAEITAAEARRAVAGGGGR